MGWQRLALRVAGAGLLVSTGAVHLDLYLTGYRSIPEVGPLFLVQAITACGLGVVVLVSGRRLAALGGAALALSTLGGYLLSLRIGLFGFREVRTAAGIAAGVVEVTAFAALAGFALGDTEQLRLAGEKAITSKLSGRLQAAISSVRWGIATLTLLAAILLGLGLASPGPAPTSTGSSVELLRIARVGDVSVVTNARGFTLYWFGPDTPTKSNCYGTCAVYWPPLVGIPRAGPGVTGELGTIRRSHGAAQITYDGHPLYSYVGDGAPGQAAGNNIDLNGGAWHEMAASG
jgi:predicted lipoprotein with Yx(FWY)xxD motif